MRKKEKQIISPDAHYKEFLQEIKEQIYKARILAARSVNRELIDLYWNIGKDIVEKQEKFGWGKSVVESLSKDLRSEFSGNTGFSVQNLWYMRQFYLEYKDYPNLQQLVGEIPWGQNLLIISKIKDIEERKYYLTATSQCGWSRNVLLNQIKSKAYERHCVNSKQHNFVKALPIHLAEQADEAMKDVYSLDFLGITKPVLEREIENRMIPKIKEVILELDMGFVLLVINIKFLRTKKIILLIFYFTIVSLNVW